ncbi:MAG: low molecular weight phosphotyrosine protein phosphatase [Cohaesibacteraceae bacterium]|nr:low molecular weight phosphotyrosine protein phosphatase [Cohaesibacteraceae bacterium]
MKSINSVLFVCLGNICRSPLAEGVFRHVVDNAGKSGTIRIESAGTGGWHIGNLPDERSIAIAQLHGIDISNQRAQQVTLNDFLEFDLILAMDRDNLSNLEAMCPKGSHAIIALYRDYCLAEHKDVPDPYYGGTGGFEEAYQLASRCSNALMDKLAG